ncbi:uncharacterized protein VTP21DRAFT_10163 [Calcarisporiella thermophila]|uniref:uncharacterized protein n=1 Tax=Calcarisporiella thermophila TaxID=911321 RepID=UPI003742DF65
MESAKASVFSPIIIFHGHESNGTNASTEHRRRVQSMLATNTHQWLTVFEDVRKCETKRLESESERRRPSSPDSAYASASSPPSCHPFAEKRAQPPPLLPSAQQQPASQSSDNGLRRRRGNLPKATTAILRQWLTEHLRRPYPTEEEKLQLACKTKLSLNQISNWFINARRRYLRPMMEGAVGQSSRLYTQSTEEGSSEEEVQARAGKRMRTKTSTANGSGGYKRPRTSL